jgi:hypothetical protein
VTQVPTAVHSLTVAIFLITTCASGAKAQVVREAQLGTLRVKAPIGYHLGVASDQGLIGVFPDSVKGGPPPSKNRQGFQLGGQMFTRLQERCAGGVPCGSFRRAGIVCLTAATSALSTRADSGLTAIICREPGDSAAAFFMGDTTRFATFFETFVISTLRPAH